MEVWSKINQLSEVTTTMPI